MGSECFLVIWSCVLHVIYSYSSHCFDLWLWNEMSLFSWIGYLASWFPFIFTCHVVSFPFSFPASLVISHKADWKPLYTRSGVFLCFFAVPKAAFPNLMPSPNSRPVCPCHPNTSGRHIKRRFIGSKAFIFFYSFSCVFHFRNTVPHNYKHQMRWSDHFVSCFYSIICGNS